MDQEKGPISWLKRLFTKEAKPDQKKGKYQYLLIVFLVGAAFMLVSNILFKDGDPNVSVPVSGNGSDSSEEVETFGQKKSAGNDIITNYEEQFETQLKDALDEIAGVSDVTVVVNVEATERMVYEKNTVTSSQKTEEKDREGGERVVEDLSKDEQMVIIRDGEKEVPILLETKKPEIRGVLVVAKGADNIQVKKWIIESVTKLLDVPSHRVSVMPKK
ncbi:stage III sporulation protein AG [Bacillus dakarensis]|uniref:stage III sporulation protein AG n=1 Tax=Robertmurraya dakarensis TaxID=1926278 RepID=UPI000980A676|nr:stage III sporulation protein AG [Bacillus dakarensis]